MQHLIAKGSKEEGVPIMDFREFIKNIEVNCERSLINLKNKKVLKQKIKNYWLCKSKIIPPSFPKLQQNVALSTIESLKPSYLYQNKHSNEFISISLTSNKTEQKFKSLSRIHNKSDIRKAVSCDRMKTNWKLQLRKDELNILKYAKYSETESFEIQCPIKSFKVRRPFRKITANKSQGNSFDKDNYRQRLKTLNADPTLKSLE